MGIQLTSLIFRRLKTRFQLILVYIDLEILLQRLEESMETAVKFMNCPLYFVCRRAVVYKSRYNPISLVLLHTDGSSDITASKKSSISGSAFQNNGKSSFSSEVNTIGIIGSISPVSMLDFLGKLVSWSSQEEETLPFLVCNDPVLNKELLSHKRRSLTYVSKSKSSAQLDPAPVIDILRRKVAFLEQAGARCIVMPCEISNAWYDEISKECGLPFLHVGECVAKELKETNMKPLEAGSSLRIGVVATDATLKAGFYQKKLQSQGFEVVLPDKATMDHAVNPAIEALNKNDMEGARNLLRIALQLVLVRAVNRVVLASDDMRGLLPEGDPLLRKCINPMDSLVRSTIIWAKAMKMEAAKDY